MRLDRTTVHHPASETPPSPMCLPLALTIALALAFPVAVAHGATSAGEATPRCTRSLTAARWTDGTAPKAREED